MMSALYGGERGNRALLRFIKTVLTAEDWGCTTWWGQGLHHVAGAGAAPGSRGWGCTTWWGLGLHHVAGTGTAPRGLDWGCTTWWDWDCTTWWD